MKRRIILGLLALICLPVASVQAQHWPSFRGPAASGVADRRSVPPTEWNVGESKNVLWKTSIPGIGHSSPIVWGEKVFITTAVSSDPKARLDLKYEGIKPADDSAPHSWQIYCLDKRSGRVLWTRAAYQGVPKTKRHPKASQANPTPVTDGRYVVALFGSEGIYVYDMSGNLRWKRDLGIFNPGAGGNADYSWGYSSSPVIYRGLVFVQCDGHAQSSIAAYRLKDGQRVWMVERSELPAWSTPTIYEGSGQAQLVTNSGKHIFSYDPLTGRELWRFADDKTYAKIPTPVAGHGLIYFTGGWPLGRPIYAIRATARGDISLAKNQESNAHVSWRVGNGGPLTTTPIIYGDSLYVCNDKGILSCYDAKSGELLYQVRIADTSVGFSASPVAAGGKLYLASEDGEVYVVKAGPKYELLATNAMDDGCMATPAIADGMIIIRTRSHIYGIGDESRQRQSQRATSR